jgi:hypothetical protein
MHSNHEYNMHDSATIWVCLSAVLHPMSMGCCVCRAAPRQPSSLGPHRQQPAAAPQLQPLPPPQQQQPQAPSLMSSPSKAAVSAFEAALRQVGPSRSHIPAVCHQLCTTLRSCSALLKLVRTTITARHLLRPILGLSMRPLTHVHTPWQTAEAHGRRNTGKRDGRRGAVHPAVRRLGSRSSRFGPPATGDPAAAAPARPVPGRAPGLRRLTA